VEYTTIGQVASEIEGTDEERVEQSMLPAMDNDVEVDNDIDDDNLDIDHDDAKVDDDIDNDNLDTNHDDDAPLRFRSINNILGTARFELRALVAEELYMVSSDGLATFIEAMMEEMTSIKENDTWSLVNLPPGLKLIGVKWVFKVKWDEHGAVSKHKARHMLKGYSQ
jgi:hypothetical protein